MNDQVLLYRFSQARNFLANPTDHWKMMNFKGEVYEACFYESLRRESHTEDGSSGLLVAKGRYAPPSGSDKTDGFIISHQGNCTYNEGGITLAEFDAIVISRKCLTFFECTLTTIPKNLKTLHAETCRKRALMKRLFPKLAVKPVVVSSDEEALKFFRKRGDIATRYFDAGILDLDVIARQNRPRRSAPVRGMIPAVELDKRRPRSRTRMNLDENRKVCQLRD